MPRKGAAKAKAKSAQVKKAEKKNEKLIEKLEARVVPSEEKAAKRARTEDSSFNKLLQDNFYSYGFTEEELCMYEKDGEVCIDELKRDRQLWLEGKKQMGKNYYVAMRKKYRDPESPYGKLVVADQKVASDEQLFESLVALHETQKDNGPFYTWAEQVTDINQTSLVALLKNALITPVLRSLPNAMIVIETMRVVKRLRVDTTFPFEWSQAKLHSHMACKKQLADFHKQDLSTSDWWEQADEYATLLVPQEDTNKVMGASESWSSVKEHVAAVYASGPLGEQMVGKIMKQLELENVMAIVGPILAAFDNTPITLAALKASRKKFVEGIKASGVDPYEPFSKPKATVGTFRAVQVKTPAKCAYEQYSFAEDCMVLTRGIEQGDAPPMWCEDDLVPTKPERVEPCEKSLFKGAITARKAVADSVDETEATALNISRAMKEKASFASSTDKMWRVTAAFWDSVVGTAASGRVHTSIVDCLPKVGAAKTCELVLADLQALQKSKFLSFAGVTFQKSTLVVAGWVESVKANRPPKLEKLPTSDFANSVKEALGRLCTLKQEGAAELCGKPAVEKMWEQLQQPAPDVGKEEDAQLLRRLYTWQYLLKKEQAKTVCEHILKLNKEHPASVNVVETVKDKASKNKVDTRAMVRGMFGKA